MKKNYWFVTGLILFSILLGLLTGASNSPVVGVVITSLTGIIATLAGMLFNKKYEGDVNRPSISFNSIGKCLALFSICLVIGVYAGIVYRTGGKKKVSTGYVWDGSVAPKSTYEALDWIMVNELLASKGFTIDQIKSLYAIRVNEKSDSGCNHNYSEQIPYYKMLSAVNAEKKGRGPASEEK